MASPRPQPAGFAPTYSPSLGARPMVPMHSSPSLGSVPPAMYSVGVPSPMHGQPASFVTAPYFEPSNIVPAPTTQILTERPGRAPRMSPMPAGIPVGPTGSYSLPPTNLSTQFDMAASPSANLYGIGYGDSKTYWARASRVLQVDPNAKKLLGMASAMFLLFVFELAWSVAAENLALFAAAFHSFYDAAALGISFVTLVLSKERPSKTYSYGLERTEIVAAFSNGALLIFVALYIGFEAVEHIFEPPEELAVHNIALIGIIGLIVHLVAVSFFRENIKMRAESVIDQSRATMETRVVEAFLDAAPSLGVIASSSMIHLQSWTWSDALVSLLISLALLVSAFPICIATGRVLLQSVPQGIKDLLEKCLRDASAVDGVLEIKQSKSHFWTYSPGVFVGTMLVKIRADADSQKVLAAVRDIFEPIVQHMTIQVEKPHDHTHDDEKNDKKKKHEHDHEHDHDHDHHDHDHHDHTHDDHCDHDHDHDHHDHHHFDHDHKKDQKKDKHNHKHTHGHGGHKHDEHCNHDHDHDHSHAHHDHSVMSPTSAASTAWGAVPGFVMEPPAIVSSFATAATFIPSSYGLPASRVVVGDNNAPLADESLL